MSAADRARRRARVAGILALAAVAAGIGVWLRVTDPIALRQELQRGQFWVLEALALIVAGVSIYQWPHVPRLAAVSRRHLAGAACASAIAWLLAASVAPRTSRIFYDEQIYQSVGQNFRDLRLAQLCNDGSVRAGRLECRLSEYNKQPYGYPYLLALAYRVGGLAERIAFDLNTVCAALTVWVVFFATAVWFEHPAAAVFAALVAALVPLQIVWSNTAASEPTASLFAAAAVLACGCFARTGTTLALWWAAALALFAAQFRPESVLILPFAAVLVLAGGANGVRAELARPRLWWTAAAALLLGAALVAHGVAVRGERWGTEAARVSLSYVAGNLRTNGWFYLGDPRFPAAYTALALIGVATTRRWRTLVPVVYFAMFWAVFLVFYAGSYDYGADVRYSLMTYPPIAMLAGLGAAAVASGLRRAIPSSAAAAALVAGALLLQFVWYLPLVRAVGDEGWGARADVEFARAAARRLPPGSIVLSHDPSMFQVWGISAAQTVLASTDPGYVRGPLAAAHPGGVYLHWGFWCNVFDPAQTVLCERARDRFTARLVEEHRERDFRYAFYKLD